VAVSRELPEEFFYDTDVDAEEQVMYVMNLN
jgi:hypothetical protein